MAKKFAEHNGLNLTQTNNDVLAAWEKNDIFHKSIDEREGCPQFIFFEGPPSANGHPGIHHVLARSIKDTFNRYKTMKGFLVPACAYIVLAVSLNLLVGICGELGADETLTETFLRMGFDELSVSPSMILRIRDKIRNIDLSEK